MQPVHTPTPTPVPVQLTPPRWGSAEKVYRRIRLHWSTLPDAVAVELEWRDDYDTTWQTSHVTTEPSNESAIVAGLPSKDSQGNRRTGVIQFQLTVSATDGQSVTVNRSISRPATPDAIGHQHDNTVGFSLVGLGVSGLSGDVRSAAVVAVRAWNNERYINTCAVPCDLNSDNAVVTVQIGGRRTCTDGNDPRVGCAIGSYGAVDTQLGDIDIYISDDPHEGNRQFYWTRTAADDGHAIKRGSPISWYYLDAVVLHEFGHPFGLKNSPHGVMSGDHSIGADDRIKLKKIYEGHRDNPQW